MLSDFCRRVASVFLFYSILFSISSFVIPRTNLFNCHCHILIFVNVASRYFNDDAVMSTGWFGLSAVCPQSSSCLVSVYVFKGLLQSIVPDENYRLASLNVFLPNEPRSKKASSCLYDTFWSVFIIDLLQLSGIIISDYFSQFV